MTIREAVKILNEVIVTGCVCATKILITETFNPHVIIIPVSKMYIFKKLIPNNLSNLFNN
ncbi:hypothetical protein PSKAS_09820 [Peribacillus sp. N1]